MQYSEHQFSCTGGDQLFYCSWIPSEAPRAALIIIHGFSDHSGRYLNIVDNLVPRGIAVYSFDQRGHGRSPGQRGHINNFTEFRDDLLTFTQVVAAQEPDLPLFMLGHSMGGLIVLDFGLHHPQEMAGVIATSPLLSDPPVSPLLTTLSRAVSSVWPTFSMDAGIDNDGLSRDPEVVQAFLNDPLAHGKGSARLSTEVSKAVAATNANAANFQPPLLITHGTADQITDPQASRRFYENVISTNKRYIAYEGGYHEGHNDSHHQAVVNDINLWLEEQMEIITPQPQ